MNSICATPTFVMTATSGAANAASGAISPGMVHPDFPNGNFIFGCCLKHRARQADMIVEIPFRFRDAKSPR